MKRVLIAFMLLATAVAMSGCFIDISAVSKVNADGSGFRITTYTADGASEKEELLKYYLLPAGGSWKLDSYVEGKPPLHVYEIKREFREIKELSPDYVRKGADPLNVSGNECSLDIRKGMVFTTYRYEEIYRDCADQAKIRAFCDGWYNSALEIMSDEVAKAFPRSVKMGEVKPFLDGRFRPYYDYFLKEFLANGRKSFEGGDSAANNAKMAEFEAQYEETAFAGYMADYIVSADKGQDRKRVYDKLLALHEKIDGRLSAMSESLNESNYGDAFGVYGWPLFMGYSFKVSVTLPGQVVEANTSDIKSGTVTWNFNSDDFQMKEYRLTAVSRRFNPAGAVIIAAGILLAAYAAYRGKHKKK